ncbi:hypothetical protein QR98_0036020 [Sarcoptes scabiei]|uniref:Uncharacterized protein n=1 Tax=Sarcoptes scabiei TaxID=52283 RepID=A0A132A2I6_SARSC|nr:hypothetical protein QR98_0036020 [Sarcoptes scabiei]
MSGKKNNKKGGNLILISGGKCGSPTLIKGGGKKGGGEMILVGGQNNCEEKKQVHVVKQLVPVPYYVPKPIIKYILRHHYVPVRHVVMKPIPVPYPIKSSYKHGGYDSSYDSSPNMYESGSGSHTGRGGSENTYDGPSAYGSYENDRSYQMNAPGSKYYQGPTNYEMSYDDSHQNIHGSPTTPNLSATNSGYERQTYESTPYSISPTGQSIVPMENIEPSAPGASTVDEYHNGAPLRGSNGYDSAATNSYYYVSSQSYDRQAPSNKYPLSSSNSDSSMNSNYQMYAPIYSGPDGQLFTSSQIFNETEISNPSSASATLRSNDSSSIHSNVMLSDQAVIKSPIPSLSRDFLRIRENSQERSSTSQRKSKSYKNKLEKAKKLVSDQFSSIAATMGTGSSDGN